MIMDSPVISINFIKLREYLKGTLSEWNIVSKDRESFLAQLLIPSAGGISHTSLIVLLKTLGPRQVCQYQFRANDIVWICKNCQKDETCVLCNECYLASEHEGHDVYFYHSAAGGCCDCGDPDAWDPNGFCAKHGKKHHDPMSFIPTEMKINTEIMCQEIVNEFLDFCKDYCDLQKLCNNIVDDQPYSIYLYFDEFHSLEEFQRMLMSEALEMLLDGHPENVSEQALSKIGWVRLRSNIPGDETRSAVEYLLAENFTVRAFNSAMRKRYDAMLSALRFLQSIALACDGMCKIVCSNLSSDRLSKMIDYDMFLDRDLGRIFHDLLLSLMADQSFKMVAAIAYTQSFKQICRDYNDGIGTAGFTMFSLSVQFLNREVFVHEICYHHGYLEQCTSVLNALIVKIKDGPKVLKSHSISKRRYSPIIGDLKVIGTIPDISRLFLTKNLVEWMDILEHTQMLHVQRRIRDVHVQYEDLTWMTSFNLTLGLSSLFDFFCNWFAKTDSHQLVTKYSQSSMCSNNQVTLTQTSVIQALSYVCDRCIQWQGYHCAKEYELVAGLLASTSDLVMLDGFTSIKSNAVEQFSFHIAMYRFFAHMMMEALKYPHLISTINMVGERLLNFHPCNYFSSTMSTGESLSNLSNPCVMLQFVLRPIHFTQQVKRNMWRRNGSTMYDQVMNYAEPPYCRIFRDMDALLTQFCMVKLPAKISLWYVFAAFDVLPCVVFPDKHLVTLLKVDHPFPSLFNDYLEYSTAMTTDSLQLLINLISELPTEPQEKVSERLIPLLRRELIHVLAAGSVTYSKLQETMAVFHDTDKLTSEQIDEIVSDVADRINPTNVNAPPLFVLKKEHWSLYDPCFSRLSDQMHSKALELRPKFMISNPITPPPFACHPFFRSLRSSILFDEFLIIVLRNLVYISARNYTSKAVYAKICRDWILSNSDKFFPKVIHLITLSIYEAQSQSEDLLDVTIQGYLDNFSIEIEMEALDRCVGPSLLESLHDIYLANEVSTLGNDYHCLGWIIEQVKSMSASGRKLIEGLERKASGAQHRKANLDSLKVQSQQNALQSIQAAAAQFMAMMDDMSDDEDEVDSTVEEGIGNPQTVGIIEDDRNSAQNLLNLNIENLNDIGIDDGLDILDEVLGEIGQPFTSASGNVNNNNRNSARLNRESGSSELLAGVDGDDKDEKQCIICMSSSNDSCMGLLGLCQPSNVLWPKSHRPNDVLEGSLFCADVLPKVDHTKFLTPDLESCNLHLSFCGHYMHVTCHLQYFYSSSRKSVYQDNMMLDPSLGYFPCPLCKKLCNCFLPVPTDPALFRQKSKSNATIEDIANSNNPRSSLVASMRNDWAQWLEMYLLQEVDSNIKLMNGELVQDYLDQERFVTYLFNTMGPLVSGTFMTRVDSKPEDKVQLLELLIACVTYTLCCDLMVGEVPGYSLDVIQSMWSDLDRESEIGASNHLNFKVYAPGQDDLRRVSDIMPLIALFAVACRFDKLTITSLVQRVAGQCIAPSSIAISHEREKYWMQNPSAPLLTLPLLDTVVFVVSLCPMAYKYSNEDRDSDASDDENDDARDPIPLEKLIPWLCVASLVQIILINRYSYSDQEESTMLGTMEIVKLKPLVALINCAWQNSKLGINGQIFCPLERSNMRMILFEWTVFLRSVVHVLLRTQDADSIDKDHLGSWLFQKVEQAFLSEDLVINYMKFLGLDALLPILCDDNGVVDDQGRELVQDIMESWFSALAFDGIICDEMNSIRGDSIATLIGNIQRGSGELSSEVKIEDKQLQLNLTTMLTSVEQKSIKVKFYPLLPKYKYYPSLSAPSLFPLPRDYSKLHALVSSIATYEFPAVCLQCGAVLDASGQGQCLSHSYVCSKGIGLFFTLQDCRVVLSHGPRCAYFASPYTDKYGEIRQSVRGKPLQLDYNRYEALKKMWLKHFVPSEVYSIRSSASRVIINGYY